MQARAKTTDEKIRAKINADLEAMHKHVAEVEQHIQSFTLRMYRGGTKTRPKSKARWRTSSRADKANADLKEGREKAKAEFKQTA